MKFTHTSYREFLRVLARNGYLFAPFGDAEILLESGNRPFILLRHDIDFDLEAAARMARIEQEEGLRATYFFLIRTLHYNLFSREGSCLVQEILDRGHSLGLHFDCASYENLSTVDQLSQACLMEASMLKGWFRKEVEIVSYHRPSPQVLSGDAMLSYPLPHTYQPLFTKRIHYCSDSRGEWRHGDPLSTQAFAEKRPLHVLIHPIWWNEDVVVPQEAIAGHLTKTQRRLEESAAGNCTVYRPAT